jgi:predicted transcriptional regulator
MESINFKVPKEMAEELDRLAEKYNERSRHLYARRAVEEYLKNSRQHQIDYSLKEIRDEIEKLREELSTALGALLLKAGKVETMEEAMEWVRKTFCP